MIRGSTSVEEREDIRARFNADPAVEDVRVLVATDATGEGISQQAIEYVFKQRGLSRQTVQDFQIGYAPDSGTALLTALEKRGFTKREINDAGLLNRYGKDLFRGRMMVPLMDQGGQVIGFTGLL